MMRKLTATHDSLTLVGGLLSLIVAVAGHCPVHASTSAVRQNAMMGQSPQESGVRELQPGVSVEGELAGVEKHHYRIVLAADQHVSFQIEKRGIILSLTLKDPVGVSIFEGTLVAREQGAEVVSLVARTAGPHTLTISPNFKKAPAGHYRVKADELRAATEQDRRRFAARQGVAEGDRLFDQGTKKSRLESLKKLSEALDIWRSLGDRAGATETLQRLGLGYMWSREFEAAHRHLNQALELCRTNGDKTAEAETLRAAGMVYAAEAKNKEALNSFTQAEAMQQDLAERWQLAVTQLELGKIHWRLGQRDKMNSYFAEGLRRLGEVGDIENEAGTRVSLSFLQLTGGEYQSALDNLLPALDLFRTLENEYAEAAALHTLGSIYYNLGEPRQALECFTQSFKLADERVDLEYGAPTLTNIGITHSTLGDKQLALKNFAEALERARKSKNPRSESLIQSHIGKVYLERGELTEALKHLNQRLRDTREQSDPAGEADALTSIGEVHAAAGDHGKALEELNRALPIRREVGDSHGEAATLYALAKVERGRGGLPKARTHIEAALKIIESLRAKVAGAELRISYLAAHQSYYELYIDLLMHLHQQAPAAGHDADALQASERARGRALLESLAEARANIRERVSPDLLERERSLARQLNAREERSRRLRTSKPKPKPEDVAAADREVEALLEQFKLVQAQIRAASPRYAALTQPQPLDLKHIQGQLDDKTLLLVYSLGRERSFLFAVTPASVRSYVLAGRDVIEQEANDVYTLLKDNAVEVSKRGDGRAVVTDRAGLKKRHLLSQRLLGPVAGQLAGKRLVIVADGKLHYVPFAALPEPGGKRLLVEGHEIVNLPSLSVLEQLRRELAARPVAPKSVAIFADPVYSLEDERFKTKAAQLANAKPARPVGTDPLAPVNRAVKEAGLKGPPLRLRASRREANEITRLFPPATYTKILGFEANRATLDQTDLSRYRIIHFATHGLLNSQNPELSGVVLSLYDEDGQAQDGLLRTHEIYNLKLGADLVVLSACQTALGKVVRGEGLIGMARGFMYAGAPRVVVSLWKVEDAATTELMSHFYRGMTQRRLTPAAALREAQAAMARRGSSPYNWAGFVLQGEWR